jgi:hypothetical protein
MIVQTCLSAGIRCTEKVRNGSTGDSRSGTSITALNSADGRDRNLFLAEASLDVGDDRREDEDLGNHVCRFRIEKVVVRCYW